jgi:predicted membrane GTPase involved in stress response
MYAEYPIECLCTHTRERFQLAFANRALELVQHLDEVAYQSSARGLVMYAETEASLTSPCNVLREVYGHELRISGPAVRYRQGAQLEEPYMVLRVYAGREHFHSIRRRLDARGAAIVDSELTSQYAVIRATAPLRALLGCHTEIEQITHGRAQHTMWLSHYAPIDEPPPRGTAA